jgi:hypothetical protein
MTGAARAFWGVALGSLVALMAFPASRKTFASTFYRPTKSLSQEPLGGEIPANKIMPDPVAVSDASMWMQVASERIMANSFLSRSELAGVIDVATSAARTEPDNAFWKQMLSVFYQMSHRTELSKDFWEKSTHCERWNDGQTRRMTLMRDDLAQRCGADQAWMSARVYSLRSRAPTQLLQNFAHLKIQAADLGAKDGRYERYLALANGRLIRDYAQSLEAGEQGAVIVEEACQPKYQGDVSRRKLIDAQNNFVQALRLDGRLKEADTAADAYAKNDRWRAYIDREPSQGVVRNLAASSVLATGIPGAMLGLALAGLICWLAGSGIERSTFLKNAMKPPMVYPLSLVLGTIAYAVTFAPSASLSVALCAAFISVSPKQERKGSPESLGLLFELTTWVFALCFAAVFCAYLVARTPGAYHISLGFDFGTDVYDLLAVFKGLSMIVISLLFVAATAWGFASHFASSAVLSLILRKFGATIGIVGLIGAIVLCPLGMAYDRSLGVTTFQMMTQEPLYYYTKPI